MSGADVPNGPDRNQIKAFYSEMFRHADEGTYAAVRAFHDDRPDPFAHSRWGSPKINGAGFGPLVNCVFDLVLAASDHSHPVVVCPPLATFSKPNSAKEVDLANGLVLSVELDAEPKAALTKIRSLLGRPTAIVASGGKWTNPATGEVEPKLHVHYRLPEPTRSAEEHALLKEMRACLAAFVGGDPSNIPAVHPLRSPGSPHRKREHCWASLLELNPDVEIDLSQVQDLLPPLPVRAGSFSAVSGDARDMADLVRLVTTADSYHGPLASLAMRQVKAGQAGGQVVETLRGLMLAVPMERRDAGQPGRWQARFDEIPKLVTSAEAKLRAQGETVEANSSRPPDGTEEQDESDLSGWSLLSDDGLALRIADRYGNDWRYVARWSAWYRWAGPRWVEDETVAVFDMSRRFLRGIADRICRKDPESDPSKTVKELKKAAKVAAVTTMLKADRRIAGTVEQWDRDPWKLGSPSGVIDLRSGQLNPPQRADYITKSTAVVPAASGTIASNWMAFLERIFRTKEGKPDHNFIKYAQRVLGYALVGEVQEHALFFCFGQGANGKGVLLNTCTGILGDYAKVAPADMFLVSQTDRHPTDMAMLRGARLVVAQETPPGRQWDEAKVKSLTGGDPISARFMRADFFTYQPQFALVIAGNTKPALTGVGEAIRRRFHLLPFDQIIPPKERDGKLTDKLRAEWPAILRWMIDGCLEWQRIGLQPPEGVVAATNDYLAGEDIVGQWLGECCDLAQANEGLVGTVYGSWKTWAETNGARAYSAMKFSKILTERGFARRDSNGKRYFDGLSVRGRADSCISDVTRAYAYAEDTSEKENPALPRTDFEEGLI